MHDSNLGRATRSRTRDPPAHMQGQPSARRWRHHTKFMVLMHRTSEASPPMFRDQAEAHPGLRCVVLLLQCRQGNQALSVAREFWQTFCWNSGSSCSSLPNVPCHVASTTWRLHEHIPSHWARELAAYLILDRTQHTRVTSAGVATSFLSLRTHKVRTFAILAWGTALSNMLPSVWYIA